MDDSQIYFSRIKNIVKYHQVENSQDMVDRTASIKEYLDTLNIDRRKIAVGFDIVIWYFDMFFNESTKWNQNFSSTYGGAPYELAFLAKRPASSLMSFPAWNTGLAKLLNDESSVTFVNSYQLDLFENFCKNESETWNYETVLRQEVEAGTAGPFDYIAINAYDIIHDPSLVVSYFNMLATGGVLVIGHINNNALLYEVGAEYSPYYEVHQNLKNINNCRVYHDYTVQGTTVAIKL